MGLFRKQGGGFLNGVNGRVESIKFDMKEFEGAKGAYHKLSAELAVAQDGAEEAVQQFLDAGFIYPDRDEAISDDGSTLEGGAQVAPDSEFGLLIQSAIANGLAEAEFPEDGSNFEALTQYRVTFGKEINRARQLAAGLKKLGAKASAKPNSDGTYTIKGKSVTEADVMTAGRRQDTKDKTRFYNHDRLIVTAVLGSADEKPAKKGAKPAVSKKAVKEVEEADYTEQADAMLIELIGASKDGVIKKSSLASLVVKKALEDDVEDEVRDGVRALFSDDDYLGRAEGWTFDEDAKTVSIARKASKKR